MSESPPATFYRFDIGLAIGFVCGVVIEHLLTFIAFTFGDFLNWMYS